MGILSNLLLLFIIIIGESWVVYLHAVYSPSPSKSIFPFNVEKRRNILNTSQLWWTRETALLHWTIWILLVFVMKFWTGLSLTFSQKVNLWLCLLLSTAHLWHHVLTLLMWIYVSLRARYFFYFMSSTLLRLFLSPNSRYMQMIRLLSNSIKTILENNHESVSKSFSHCSINTFCIWKRENLEWLNFIIGRISPWVRNLWKMYHLVF